ncbi:endocuticle structural protein SgAbd-6-like [Stomoxys calcitrans]|uniref:endocuticle structural protein SgAbd-6-like n=1 Tax=Stomoxys calcitrans TaxID=35570 RepID=UPI0027E314DE|nr:endocuticle structural protein SgAbd-6-like [Stomoxys calcitrans]
MKFVVVFGIMSVLLACAWAAPQGKDVEVLEQSYENTGSDGYKFSYSLTDGTSRTEQGTVVNPGAENESLSVKGTITWVAPDGQTYTVNFVADENGFQPEGAHLPK